MARRTSSGSPATGRTSSAMARLLAGRNGDTGLSLSTGPSATRLSREEAPISPIREVRQHLRNLRQRIRAGNCSRIDGDKCIETAALSLRLVSGAELLA